MQGLSAASTAAAAGWAVPPDPALPAQEQQDSSQMQHCCYTLMCHETTGRQVHVLALLLQLLVKKNPLVTHALLLLRLLLRQH
jgi:hypothetical protein